MRILLLSLLYGAVTTIPINKSKGTDHNYNGTDTTNKKIAIDVHNVNFTENYVKEESRAGLIENLNPFNKEQQPQTSNKDNGQNSNNPLGAVQNLFTNASQIFNISNPFEQIFSTQSGGNFLDNIKLFFVSTQGMVMPASSVLGGLQNIFETLSSNAGNFMQAPSLPNL